MNFDVRAYCERLAKAYPERFEFIKYDDESCFPEWGLVDRVRRWVLESDGELSTLWAFVGPLADELLDKRQYTDYEDDGPGYTLQWSFCLMASRSDVSLLEATFAAVCEKLEAKR